MHHSTVDYFCHRLSPLSVSGIHTSCMLDLNILRQCWPFPPCFFFIIRSVHFWLLFLQSAFQMGLDTKLELRWWYLDATRAISEWITASADFLSFLRSAEQYLETQSYTEYTSGLLCRVIFLCSITFSNSRMHLLWHTVYIIYCTGTQKLVWRLSTVLSFLG